MKHIIILTALFIFLGTGQALYAQSETETPKKPWQLSSVDFLTLPNYITMVEQMTLKVVL
jgi:hypothetical protein